MVRKRRINVGINKSIILESIVRNEPTGGIGTIEISRQTKLHRDTVRRLCKELENEFWIFKRHKGDKYHLTEKSRNSPNSVPFFLGDSGLVQSRFWSPICASNKFCNNRLTRRLIRSKGMKITGNGILYLYGNRGIEEMVLFEFANRIGALITYLLIQALRPRKSEIAMDSVLVEVENADDYELARKWIRKAINPESILDIFSDLPLLNRRIKHIKLREKKLSAVVDEKGYRRLIETFRIVYHDIFENLETKRKQIVADSEEIYADFNADFNELIKRKKTPIL